MMLAKKLAPFPLPVFLKNRHCPREPLARPWIAVAPIRPIRQSVVS
ncbi:hypothetical protein ACVDG5_020215 [Mesorhizobium sp. ORM6]